MKAVVYHRYGSPDVLQCEDVEKPTAGDNEVLIRVHAASVNPLAEYVCAAELGLVLKPSNVTYEQAAAVAIAALTALQGLRDKGISNQDRRSWSTARRVVWGRSPFRLPMTPVIDRGYPLSEVSEAITYLEEGHAQGKVVITVAGCSTSQSPPT